MNKHPLYDIAVAEVRSEATKDEIARLNSNVFEWRDALLAVIDEVNAQLDLKDEEHAYELTQLEEYGTDSEIEELNANHSLWRNRALRFRKHVKARVDAVKRMCRDQMEGAEGVTYDLEKAMKVVTLAIELVDAEAGGDQATFDDVFDQLELAVEAYREAGNG
ncbi:MAG: hypothetical protein ACWGQW_11385 [bacterium]